MRTAFAFALALTACGPAEPGAVLCEPEHTGDATLRVDAPTVGDTLVLGVPFRVEVATEAEGRVGDVWVQLHWEPDGGRLYFDDRVLYRRVVSTGPGRYTARFLVQIDSLPNRATAESLGGRGTFFFGVRAEEGMNCVGTGREAFGEGGASAPVTVLDRPAPP